MVSCDITLSLLVCIVSINVISEFQRERLHPSHAIVLIELELWMSMWMNTWIITASEELSVFIVSLSSSIQSMTDIFHTREVWLV